MAVGKLTARLEKKAETQSLPSPAGTDLKGWSGRGAGGEGSSQRDTDSDHNQPQSALILALSRKRARGPDSPVSSLPSSTFVISTPTAIVTDLGTEFGVEVGEDGRTLSHVFRGTVEMRAVADSGQNHAEPLILHASQSAQVQRNTGNQGVVLVQSALSANFVREIGRDSVLVFDLVDAVAGGNGFSHKRGRGIDPATGRTSDRQPDKVDVRGDHKYHRIEGTPFVEGVFIPDGGKGGPVQIDSAGHVFPDCPKTDNGSWAYIWAGGKLPPPIADRMSATLAGIDYCSPEHSVLVVHANKGITFDLEAIRRSNPGRKVLRFPGHNGKHGNPEHARRQRLGGYLGAGRWASAIQTPRNQ